VKLQYLVRGLPGPIVFVHGMWFVKGMWFVNLVEEPAGREATERQ